MNLREVAAKIRHIFVSFQFCLPAIFNLIYVFINGIERAEFFEQRDGSLFADSGHAGDVIRFIADDGFVIHHLIRSNAELADDVFIRDVVLVVAREINSGSFD